MNHKRSFIKFASLCMIVFIVVIGLFYLDQSQAIAGDGIEDILFSDDFSGDLSQWSDQIGDWQIDQGQLLGTGLGWGTDGYIHAGNYAWEDYVLQVDVHFVNDNAILIVRSTSHWYNEYRIDIWQQGGENSNTYTIRKYFFGNVEILAEGVSPVPITNPCTVQVMVSDNRLFLMINGSLVSQVEDNMPLPNGRIGLGVIWSYQTRFDNVLVSTLPPIVLVPPEQEKYGKPGSTLTYEIELENHTGATDSFNLQVLPGNAWTTNLPTTQVGPIGDGESASFTVTVDIPPDALPLASDTATIQAASVASPGITGTATVTTHALGEETAYVALGTSDKIALVDVATQTVYDEIETDEYGCYNPWRVSMTPGGDFVYISCYESWSVLVLDTSTNSVVVNITDIPQADDIAFTHSGDHALVGSRNYQQIAVVNTHTYVIEQFINTSGFTRSIAVHPFMPRAYVTSSTGEILVVDTNTFAIIASIAVGSDPWDVAASPNGSWVFAGDRWGDGLAVIDAATNTVFTTVTGLDALTGLEVSNDSGIIFAGGLCCEVHVIDANTFSLITSVSLGYYAWELALTGDGTQLYVGDRSDNVLVIDALNFVVSGSIPMPSGSSRGIAITPQFVAEGAFLFPLQQAKEGGRGEIVTYDEVLVNNSGDTETFTLQASGYTWDTQLSVNQIGPIASGESASFSVYVTVPPDEPWYNTDAATIVATGIGNPSLVAQAELVTTAYAPPQISIDPTSLSSTQYVGEVTTQDLTISNGEGVTLTYEIYVGTYPGNVAALHLDEPYGSTTFADVSGYGNHATCSGDECPVAGVPGAVATALDFDGVNDSIQIPHNAAFDQIEDQDKVSIAAWVYVDQWQWDAFPIMNQYGEEYYGGWEFGIHNYNIYFVAFHFNSGIGCDYYFNNNQWYHVAVTYDRAAGMIQFYVNGDQVCNLNYDYDISDTSSYPMYIGVSATDYDEYANGLIDEFYIFDRALSSDEVNTLYQGSLGGDVPWLSVDPISGDVPTNGSVQLEVTFDSTGLQPGDYATTLFINNNDPVEPMLSVPVDLTVEPTDDMGQVSGTVSDAWSGDPLTALVELEGVFTALADPDYSIWAVAGTYSITAYTTGYYTLTLPVEVVAGEVTVQDIALEPALPRLGELPEAITISVTIGTSDAQILPLINTGPLPLDFAFHELEELTTLNGVASMSGKHILYDLSHGQSDLSWYSTLTTDLIAAGATINGNYEPFDENTLLGIDILWINNGGGIWSYPELVIVEEWLANGGTILIHGENSSAVYAPASIFGVIYHSDGACYWGTTNLIYPHPITEGVDEVYYDWTCSYLSGSPDVLVAYFDLLPHMIATMNGRGKMVVVAGYDFANDRINNSDNRLLAMNTFLWLSEPVYGDIPWLSETPESGTVSGHSDFDATLTFDATSLDLGEYSGILAIEHSDESQDSPALIPMYLNVIKPEPVSYTVFMPVLIK